MDVIIIVYTSRSLCAGEEALFDDCRLQAVLRDYSSRRGELKHTHVIAVGAVDVKRSQNGPMAWLMGQEITQKENVYLEYTASHGTLSPFLTGRMFVRRTYFAQLIRLIRYDSFLN